MEMVEVRCKNCEKTMYILDEYIREDMFCTLGCMGDFEQAMMRI